MPKPGMLYAAREDGQHVYRLVLKDAPPKLLCSADAGVCDKHPHVLEALGYLALEVLTNRKAESGHSFRFSDVPPGQRVLAGDESNAA
jgi:hypothetical protein